MRLFRTRTYADRYADNWSQTAKRSHQATNRVCCLCRNASSQEAHHVRYRDWRGAIAGRERPGVDVFPVCLPCHEQLHQGGAWVKDWQNPVLGNHQQAVWVRKLQRGYRRLSGQGISIGSILLLGIAAIVGYYALGWLGAVVGAIVGLLLIS
jgi:hypothetical protein